MAEDDVLSRMEEYFHILHLGEKSLDLGKILSTDTSIKILEAVYNSDSKVGLSASEISEALDVGRTTAIYHLGRMQESGLIKINPVLDKEENWKRLWDSYRKKSTDISGEQFKRLHNARMNGVKLFVPTKKGFIVLPSTDVKSGRAIVKDALTAITAPSVKPGYKKYAKSASLLGTLGLLFIAFTFLFQGLPFPQYSGIAGAEKAPSMKLSERMQSPLQTLAAAASGESGRDDGPTAEASGEDLHFAREGEIKANATVNESVSTVLPAFRP